MRALIVVLALSVACERHAASPPGQTGAPPPAAPTAPDVMLPSQTIADIAARVTPSVVNVFSERTIARWRSPFASDPYFQYFFGRGDSDTRERSLGSGVIVSADGVILTSNHVIADADKVRVALQDGRELEAKIVGTDPQSDVAVLRVSAKNLPAIPIADSSKIRTGDLVLAIGNPFGLGQTVTMGIISAVGRANVGITEYEDFIQTDAAINPGNSGGALVDMNGRLIGINTAIVSRSGGYQGIGFAIPSNMAVAVERAILHNGKVSRGWLGIETNATTPHGVVIAEVTPNSPAARAGLARGDVIVAIDGTPTRTATQLRNVVALAGNGARVHVELQRKDQPRAVDVTLGSPPAGETVDARAMIEGVTVEKVDQAARERFGLPAKLDGVVVSKVEPESQAAELGLAEGDVIIAVNRRPTPTIDEFRSALEAADRAIQLVVVRDGATLYMALRR